MTEAVRHLTGVKVVDLTTYVAAPGCARMLAEWGADVIKIEPLGGEVYRYCGPMLGCPATPEENPQFEIENAFKRGIAVDLKKSEGQDVLHKLLKNADVLVTNYRLEALEKLGLTYEKLKELYPKLVFGHISCFGERGQMRADRVLTYLPSGLGVVLWQIWVLLVHSR